MILNNCSNCISIWNNQKSEILGLIEYEDRLKKKIVFKFVDKTIFTRAELFKICYIAVIYRKCIDRVKEILKDVKNPYQYREDYEKLLGNAVNKITEYNSNKRILKDVINDIYLVKKIEKRKQISLFNI